MGDLRTLFYKSTELNYHKQYNEILSGHRWIQEFKKYYQKEIHSKIGYIGRWRLQLHGLSTGDTNASESFNCVLKRLQDWDERPVDVIARGFLLLCQYHDTEILRGRYGMGDLTLKSSLSKVYDMNIDKPVFEKCVPPSEIVPEMMSVYSKLKAETQFNIPTDNEKDHSGKFSNFTAHEIASRLNKDDLFMRVGPGEYAIKRTTYSENHIVTIIPKTYSVLKCSCPTTDLCAHLIGYNRKAADKTSGRKQPRKLDVGPSIHIQVTPAHVNPSAINIEKEKQSTGSITSTNLPTQSVSPVKREKKEGSPRGGISSAGFRSRPSTMPSVSPVERVKSKGSPRSRVSSAGSRSSQSTRPSVSPFQRTKRDGSPTGSFSSARSRSPPSTRPSFSSVKLQKREGSPTGSLSSAAFRSPPPGSPYRQFRVRKRKVLQEIFPTLDLDL
uniref:SWIM-type domain-containing protein n=1 Tax=Daphnia galeata TaxID=27404 RepID=A0A8J2WRB5_9CRUS|nr:unnamed protein product [Daphnia galeata]